MISSFRIPQDAEALADLLRRLRSTRWNDAVSNDWSYGTERGFLQELVRYWSQDYDWPSRRERLSALPHYRAVIDGYGLHFLHFRGRGPRPMPLVLMNGWPSSFVEHQRIAPLLTAGEPSFEVVVPTHPGFGFSDHPTRPYQVEPADLYPKLMTALGHDRFMVAGTDVGSGVATRIALRHPERVLAAHTSAIASRPAAPGERALSTAERAYAAQAELWDKEEGGYQAIQSSRPQSLAFALADSPAGLAGWIVEKFRAWSDCRGDVLSVWPKDDLIDNLMIYWNTNTIGSSVRYYHEAKRLRPPLRSDDYVTVPTAVGIWPHDLARPPREAAERMYNVRRYTVFSRDGHFPAWEAAEPYADDLRNFADQEGLQQ